MNEFCCFWKVNPPVLRLDGTNGINPGCPKCSGRTDLLLRLYLPIQKHITPYFLSYFSSCWNLVLICSTGGVSAGSGNGMLLVFSQSNCLIV
jgi:hypothetical protein